MIIYKQIFNLNPWSWSCNKYFLLLLRTCYCHSKWPNSQSVIMRYFIGIIFVFYLLHCQVTGVKVAEGFIISLLPENISKYFVFSSAMRSQVGSTISGESWVSHQVKTDSSRTRGERGGITNPAASRFSRAVQGQNSRRDASSAVNGQAVAALPPMRSKV